MITSLDAVSKAAQAKGKDRSFFGYMARGLRAQFLGYVLVDQQRPTLQQTHDLPQIIPDLSASERRALLSAHLAIDFLNRACTRELSEHAIDYDVVNPYTEFGFAQPVHPPAPADLWPQDSLQGLVLQFTHHRAWRRISEQQDLLVWYKKHYGASAQQTLMSHVNTLLQAALSAGPMNAPPDLAPLTFGYARDSLPRRHLCLLGALVSLRASLRVLDQLVYQAVMHDKLAVLDERVLVAVKHLNRHLAGDGLDVALVPISSPTSLEPPNLVLVKCTSLNLDMLCQVEQSHLHFSQDTGDLVQLKLRRVDEELNPFEPFVRAI